MLLTEKQYQDLAAKYSDTGDERGGYITSTGLIVECENINPNKEENFSLSCDDLEKLENDDVIATFHTHPGKSPNLSKDDYNSFLNWENLLHFIVGKDKINCYKVTERGTVVLC